MELFKFGWAGKVLLAMFLFVPGFFLASYNRNRFGTSPEATLTWWAMFISLSLAFYMVVSGRSHELLDVPPAATTAVIACTFGVLANILLYQAFAEAPSPGYPASVIALNSVVAVLISPKLSSMFPEYFNRMELTATGMLGAALAVVGVMLVSLQK